MRVAFVLLLVAVSGARTSTLTQPQQQQQPRQAAGLCQSAADCFLNGDCVDGRCECDPAWSGSPSCDVLSFQPTPLNAGYHNGSDASWGGNAVFENGLWHLFVAQMLNNCSLHEWGTNSAIVRAESLSPLGPFEFREIVVSPFAHNPTVRRAPDGSVVLFMIGGTPSNPVNCTSPAETRDVPTPRNPSLQPFEAGIRVAWARSVYGPWNLTQIAFTNRSPLLYGGWTNPSPAFHANGSVTLAFQAHPQDPKHNWELVGVATADDFRGPYTLTSSEPVFPEHFGCVAGTAEDPFLWRGSRGGYHIIVHGMCPAGPLQAHYAFSADAKSWTVSPRQTYRYWVDYADGHHEAFARVERPQLVFAQTNQSTWTQSQPVALFNGACRDIDCLFASGSPQPQNEKQMSFTLARPLNR